MRKFKKFIPIIISLALMASCSGDPAPSISPTEGTIGTIITIPGRFFIFDISKLKVQLGDQPLEIIGSTLNQLKVRIPYDIKLVTFKGNITVSSGTQTIGSPYAFSLISPWKRLNDFPGNARYDGIGFAIGSNGYVGLGKQSGSNAYNDDIWKYNPQNDTWQTVANYGAGYYYMNQSSFVISNNAYVGIGQKTNTNNITSTNDIFLKYDPNSNTWSPSNWINESGYYASSNSAIGDKGYVITGNGSNNKNLQFNPTNNSWTEKALFPGTLRYKAATFTLDNKIYISTGAGAALGSLYTDTWMYDPNSNAWTQKSAFPGTPRWQTTCFSLNGLGFLVGGLTAPTGGGPFYLDDFWLYDPTNDKWTKLNNFPGGSTMGGVTFLLNNKIYFGTGASANGVYKNDFWEFSLITSDN